MNNFIKLKNKILNKKVNISIIGLGYVGLPLSLIFAKNGFEVIGLDIDKDKIKKLKRSKSYINHISDKEIRQARQKKFTVSNKFFEIKNSDIIIMCLPTPLKNNLEPNITFIDNTMKLIDKFLKPNQLIILESSTYPGCTRKIIFEKYIKKKYEIGKNFFIGYSPEREDPSNKKFSLKSIPKVCSGITKNCALVTKILYKKIVKKVVPVSNIETAEFTKIYENIYRNINIALVNEIKIFSKKLGLDIFEIINAAKTKPFGFQPFYPGPGVGGHCIPVDPYYLSWLAKKNNFNLNLIRVSGEINRMMPKWIIKNSMKKFNYKKPKVLLIGVSYKRNVDDIRESPSLDFLNIFHEKGISCDYHDPYVKVLKSRKLKKIYKSKKLTPSVLKKYDLTYILTDHDKIDFKIIKKYSKNLIDTRNRYKKTNENINKF